MAGKPTGGGRAAPKPKVEGRKPTARAAVVGDNSEAAKREADRKEAGYRVRMAEVRRTKALKEQAAAVLKAASKVYTEARNAFKSTTTISLKNLDRILEKAELTRGDVAKEHDDYNWMVGVEGLPAGTQLSMFGKLDKTPTLVKDEFDWVDEGRRAYHAFKECAPPTGCPPKNHQHWMKGWHEEQEKTAWAMAFPLGDEPAPPPEPDPNADPFEATPSELQQQITRQNVQAMRENLEALGTGEPESEEEEEVEEVA